MEEIRDAFEESGKTRYCMAPESGIAESCLLPFAGLICLSGFEQVEEEFGLGLNRELLAAWGTDPSGPPDFDNDGTVSILDLLALLANWGPCA